MCKLRIAEADLDVVNEVPVGPSPNTAKAHLPKCYVVPGDAVMCVAFSADGRLAALGTANGRISVYDAASWRRVADLVSHCKDLTGLAFTVDGRRLASASGRYFLGWSDDDNQAPGQIVIWDTRTWLDLLSLPRVSGQQYSGVAFDNLGRALYTSSDTTLRRWDTAKSPNKTPTK